MGETPALALVPLAQEVHRRLRRGASLMPDPTVGFYPYANGASTVRLSDGRVRFRISDRLRGAPDDVLAGVFSVLLCRFYDLPESRADAALVRHYREHQTRDDHSTSKASRGRKHIEPVGRHRSLLESYLRVSLDMGLALPRVPRLSWSKTVARHRFGHWDADHNAVVISQVLDDPDVPEFVLDHVLYHELLHIVHPTRMGSATKRIVHSAAFKRDERRFPRWRDGDDWLRRLARRRR